MRRVRACPLIPTPTTTQRHEVSPANCMVRVIRHPLSLLLVTRYSSLAPSKTDKIPQTMSDSFENQAWVRMGVAGALEQEYLKDQQFFLELLAKTMLATLPDQCEQRTKGFLKKTLTGMSV